MSWSSAHISARTRRALQPAELWGVPGAALKRRRVVICAHKHTGTHMEGAHTQPSLTHTNKLHPTPPPPPRRRSCPILTGSHLPLPEAINTTAAPSPLTHRTAHLISSPSTRLRLPSRPASLCLPLHFSFFRSLSLTPQHPSPVPTRACVLHKRNLAMLFSNNANNSFPFL